MQINCLADPDQARLEGQGRKKVWPLATDSSHLGFVMYLQVQMQQFWHRSGSCPQVSLEQRGGDPPTMLFFYYSYLH